MMPGIDTILTWHGVSLGSIITSASIWAGLIAAFGYWLRSRPALQRNRNDADSSLRGDLLDRISKLEEGAAVQTARLDQQRHEYEAKIERREAEHAAEIAIMRHRMNNLDQSLNTLLTLIEENPSRAQQAAKRVREQRQAQEVAESAEKATIQAARIVASRKTQ